MKMKYNIAIFIFITILFSACKYEKGPFISFYSKKHRVVNSWNYKAVYRNGLNITEGKINGDIIYSQSSIGFDESGKASTIITINTGNNTISKNQYNGVWYFEEAKEKIVVKFDFGAIPDQEYKIIKLKEKEMWLENYLDNNLYEYRLN
jgi:hypothetical protein